MLNVLYISIIYWVNILCLKSVFIFALLLRKEKVNRYYKTMQKIKINRKVLKSVLLDVDPLNYHRVNLNATVAALQKLCGQILNKQKSSISCRPVQKQSSMSINSTGAHVITPTTHVSIAMNVYSN